MPVLDRNRFGEGEDIEYKVSELQNRDKYLKTVVAFANGRGGKIIFGVKDDTLEVIGMPKENIFSTMDDIANVIIDSCEPKIIPRMSIMSVEDKSLIVVNILPGMMTPYYIKSQGTKKGVYLRVAGTTRHAEIYQIQELIMNGSNRSFDQLLVDGSIAENEVNAFCDRLYAFGKKMREIDKSLECVQLRKLTLSQIISWKLIRQQGNILQPTNGYLLLDGQVGENFNEPYIQCAVFKGTTKSNFITHREFHGPLYEQIEGAYNFVLQYIKIIPEIEGLVRRDFYEMPPRSIREVITNAVCHRSYLHPGHVQVALYDDRLEVTSPGMLTMEMTIEKMKRGVSIPRNKAIAEAFKYMGVIDKWGSGIPRIFADAAASGLPEPQMEDLEGQFVMWFPRRMDTVADQSGQTSQSGQTGQTGQSGQTSQSGQTDQTGQTDQSGQSGQTGQTILTTSEKEKLLLNLIYNYPKISQRKAAEKLGWTVSMTKYYFTILQERRIIIHNGNQRSGVWQILSGNGTERGG